MKKVLLFIFVSAIFLSCGNIRALRNTIDELEVIRNPYGSVPLSAVIVFNHPKISMDEIRKIEIIIAANDENSLDLRGVLVPGTMDYIRNFDVSDLLKEGQCGIPVIGLYPNHENRVSFRIETDSRIFTGQAVIITEDMGLHLKTKVIKSNLIDEDKKDFIWLTGDGNFFLTLAAGAVINRELREGEGFSSADNGKNLHNDKDEYILDRQGNVRWYISTPDELAADMRMLSNGNIMLRPWWNGNFIYEYNRMGRLINTWSFPLNYTNHHDIYEMPNGNFLVAATNKDFTTLNDQILEIDRETSQVLKVWDLRSVFYEEDEFETLNADWSHTNSLVYDEHDDSIIVSGANLGLFKLTRDDQLRWFIPRYGHNGILDPDVHGGNGLEWARNLKTAGRLAVPLSENGEEKDDYYLDSYEDFHWPGFQHNPSIIFRDNDRLDLLFFNNIIPLDGDNYSSMMVYSIYENESQGAKVQEIWEYGLGLDKLYSEERGGAVDLGDTRMMISSRARPLLVEVDSASGESIWEVRFSYWGAGYRTGKIDLYPRDLY